MTPGWPQFHCVSHTLCYTVLRIRIGVLKDYEYYVAVLRGGDEDVGKTSSKTIQARADADGHALSVDVSREIMM